MAPMPQQAQYIGPREPYGGGVAQWVDVDPVASGQPLVQNDRHTAGCGVDHRQRRHRSGCDAEQTFHVSALAKLTRLQIFRSC